MHCFSLQIYQNLRCITRVSECICDNRSQLIEQNRVVLLCFSLFRYGRADVMPLGKFSLNLTHCPPTKEYGQLIHTFIQALVTKVNNAYLISRFQAVLRHCGLTIVILFFYMEMLIWFQRNIFLLNLSSSSYRPFFPFSNTAFCYRITCTCLDVLGKMLSQFICYYRAIFFRCPLRT